MRVLFAGTPGLANPTLDALVQAGHDVVCVLTRPPARVGRGRKTAPSQVGVRAQELGLEVLTPTNPSDDGVAERIRALTPDVGVVVAYGHLLRETLLEIPTHGWINLHFSLLPKWRGAAPLQRSIIAGDPVVGATTFRIVEALDAGPVYRCLEVPLGPDQSSVDVFADLSERGASLMVETLADIANGVSPTAQIEAGVTHAPKLTTEQARIDWTRPAQQIHDHVRGFMSGPSAWTSLGDVRVKVLATTMSSCDDLRPGELRITKRNVHVGTGSGSLELLRVQPVGKKEMPAPDWARGGLRDGSVLS